MHGHDRNRDEISFDERKQLMRGKSVNQVTMAAVLMSQQRIRWKNSGGKSGLAGWR
jgi:hypothetical protein